MRPWPDDEDLARIARGRGGPGPGPRGGDATPVGHEHSHGAAGDGADGGHADPDDDSSGTGDHAHAGEHPPVEHHHHHASAAPSGELPAIGIVGAGAVGSALGLALQRAGWPVNAVASRDAGRRERFRTLVPGVHAFAEATALLDDVELVILAVPDDAIASLAGRLHLYSGQALIHTSGLLGASVLAPAMAAGTQIGSFHPLVAFADTERAVAALHGATIALEGDDQLVALLARMAEAIGGLPVRLAPGSKAAYHAAAVLAAGGVVALLDAIADLGRVAGLDEAGAITVYAPLIAQTIGNARALGIRAALTGPITRGDIGTLRAHLAELDRHAPAVLPLYVILAEREVDLAEARGSLSPARAAELRAVLRPALANPA